MSQVDKANDRSEQHQGDGVSESRGIGFPVVGIGASAGGLEALSSFFDHTRPDTGMAYVVILHLSPEYESQVDGLLQQHTTMPVQQVTERVRVEPNQVYLVPPSKQLVMEDGHLRLTDDHTPTDRRVPIDRFFRTLADTQTRLSAGIILSGSGSDGASGLKRIKERGGLVIVQDPQEAEADAMPRSALSTGMVDFVLPVVAISDMLLTYWRRGKSIALPEGEADQQTVEVDALNEIFAVLRLRTGHDFSQYKRPTLLRRIGRRMQVNGTPDLLTYLELLRSQPGEVQTLLQDLLISVTNFFRDKEAWAALEAIVPQLFAGKGPADQVRVWVCACATGEEAYSIAILLYEYARTLEHPPAIQVFATDIDTQAIQVARQGAYPDTIAGDITPERLQQCFRVEHGRYRIRDQIRELVLFAPHNVLHDPPFSRLDLVTCRNLLIYLNREVQERIIRVFHFSLRPGGYLLLGNSESLDEMSSLFTVVDKMQRLFQRGDMPVLTPPPIPSLTATRPQLLPPASSRSRDDRLLAFGELHRQLLTEYATPSVMINQDYELVHLSNGAGRFLQIEAGEPSYNLLRVVLPDLRLDLRTALFLALQQGRTERRQVQIALDGKQRSISLVVQPIQQPDWASGYFLVFFSDLGDGSASVTPPSNASSVFVSQLEVELQRTRDELRMTVEQYETAAEEYKATNEELQAINEELRAASEELETSKEELQVVNEELTTVNQELKHKVEEISQTNNDLQNLIASTQIGTIFLNRELQITRYTPSAQTIFNLIPTDLYRPIGHVTHRLDYPRLAEDAATVTAKLASVSREVQSKDGLWYLVRMVPYLTHEDRIGGVVMTFVDITERRQAESANRYLATIVQASGDAIVGLAPDGTIESWNPTAERLFGYTAREMIGSSIGVLTPTDQQAQQEQMLHLLRSGQSTRIETVRLARDGQSVDVLLNASPLKDADGQVIGISATLTEIGERKRAQAELERLFTAEQAARSEAEAALQTRDQFLSVASHELRTPMTALLGYTHILRKALQGATDVQRPLGMIERQAQRLDLLVGQLLDVARLQQGQFMLERQPLDLVVLVARVVDEFCVALPTPSACTVELTLPDSPVLVLGDANRLEAVVLNLLSNAVKYSPEGGTVQVRVSRTQSEATVEVEDSGIGIPAEAQAHLFDPFYRAHNVGSQISGLGLGLHIVAEIVRRHGGRVEVRSLEQVGSTFQAMLPLHSTGR